MKNWDDPFYKIEIIPQKVIRGLCINCPEELEVPATKQHHPCYPMCKKHYDEVMETVHIICHRDGIKNLKCNLCK